MEPSLTIVVSPTEVLHVIKYISNRKDTGEDDIANGALNNLPPKLLVNWPPIFNVMFPVA